MTEDSDEAETRDGAAAGFLPSSGEGDGDSDADGDGDGERALFDPTGSIFEENR
jgi:hypothetical protein